jgi:uncharacterized protein (DUF4415 family)
MANLKPLIDDEGEVRELEVGDMAQFVAVGELPATLQAKLGVRGVQTKPKKERITIRLSPEVLAQFRATGDGWQGRVDVALQQWLREHSPVELG